MQTPIILEPVTLPQTYLNNPFFLRPAKNAPWHGLLRIVTVQGKGQFCQFQTMYWGTRAGMLNILNKIKKQKLVTVRQLITKLSPPVENETEMYIKTVEQQVGSKIIDTLEKFIKMCQAITRVETGKLFDYDELLKIFKNEGFKF